MNRIFRISLLLIILLIIISCENNTSLEDNVLRNGISQDTVWLDTTLIDYKKVVIKTIVTKNDTIRDTVVVVEKPSTEESYGVMTEANFQEVHDVKRNKDKIMWKPESKDNVKMKLIYSMGITFIEFECDFTSSEINFFPGFKRLEAVKNFKMRIKTNLYDILNNPIKITDFATNSLINGDVSIITKDGYIIKNPWGIEIILMANRVQFESYKVKDLGITFALILPSADQEPDNNVFLYQGELNFKF